MPQVTTEHVLLGLITEDTSSKNGFLNSGITAEKARAAVQSLSGKRKPISTTDSIPFSREVRKTFEAATNVGIGCRHAKAGGNASKKPYLLTSCSAVASAGVQACSCVLHLPRAHFAGLTQPA